MTKRFALLYFFISIFLFLPVIAVSAQDSNQGDEFTIEPENAEGLSPEPRRQSANLEDLDVAINQAMQQYTIPGASLSVAYDGKLVYAKGFGLANLETQEPVTPTTLFNLASCTKAISTLGILRLVEAKRLGLDEPMYTAIGRPNLVRGMQADPRVAQITIRQLLHHSGGWNDASAFEIAGREVRQLAPNGLPYAEAVRVLLATPLDYEPGTQAVYANGQWNLLKYVIECSSGRPYGEFMQEQLNSLGIHDMCEESRGMIRGQACRYEGSPPRMIRGGQLVVPLMPSFGNWMASSIDMVKFLTAIDGTRMQGLTADSYEQMLAPLPPPMQNKPNGGHFGLGLDNVRKTPLGYDYSKNGGKPGVHSQIEHLPNGVNFCLMLNGGFSPDGNRGQAMGATTKSVKEILNNVKQWPQIDMFKDYP